MRKWALSHLCEVTREWVAAIRIPGILGRAPSQRGRMPGLCPATPKLCHFTRITLSCVSPHFHHLWWKCLSLGVLKVTSKLENTLKVVGEGEGTGCPGAGFIWGSCWSLVYSSPPQGSGRLQLVLCWFIETAGRKRRGKHRESVIRENASAIRLYRSW